MLGGLWDRITGRSRQKALDREAELEKMTPEERRQVQKYVEDIHADDSAAAHLGGFDPDRLLPGEKEPPRN
jgi:hypothetical protein